MKNDPILQMMGEIHSPAKRRTGEWTFKFESQQNVDPMVVQFFSQYTDKIGWLSFKVGESALIEDSDIKELPDVSLPVIKKDGVSKSQKMRKMIYILWTKSNKEKTQDQFYDHMMDYFMDIIKRKIDSLE